MPGSLHEDVRKFITTVFWFRYRGYLLLTRLAMFLWYLLLAYRHYQGCHGQRRYKLFMFIMITLVTQVTTRPQFLFRNSKIQKALKTEIYQFITTVYTQCYLQFSFTPLSWNIHTFYCYSISLVMRCCPIPRLGCYALHSTSTVLIFQNPKNSEL